MTQKTKRGGKRAGSGRKRSKDGPAVTISLSMPQAILGLLEAQRNGRSRSDAMPGSGSWFHTVGVTQHLGTCKWHRFEDCRHLTRPRPHWRGPVLRWGTTTEYIEVNYPESEVSARRRCQHCEHRFSLQNS